MNERPEQTAFPLWEAVCLKTAQAPYAVLYEDDAVLVCTKKAGVPVQSRDLRTPDLESMLRTHLAKSQTGGNTHAALDRGSAHGAHAASDRGSAYSAHAAAGRGCASGAPYLGIVHRLDQPVCGVLVFAKTPKAAAALSKQVQDGTMRKEYLAVCATAGQTQMVTVADYLVKDERTNLSRVVPEGTKGAKHAVLELEVLETQEELSLVHVRLHTGRHHQIRVQLAHLGCPIAGDKKYGPQAKQDGFTQLKLCAYRLVFTHPVTGKQMDFDLSEGNK